MRGECSSQATYHHQSRSPPHPKVGPSVELLAPNNKPLGPVAAGLGEGHFGSLAERLSKLLVVDDGIPFDTHCPSVASKVDERVCSTCRHYFPTKKALNSHKKSAICADYGILFDDSDEEEDHADCAVSAADPPASDAWPVLRQDDPDRYCGFELESDE